MLEGRTLSWNIWFEFVQCLLFLFLTICNKSI